VSITEILTLLRSDYDTLKCVWRDLREGDHLGSNEGQAFRQGYSARSSLSTKKRMRLMKSRRKPKKTGQEKGRRQNERIQLCKCRKKHYRGMRSLERKRNLRGEREKAGGIKTSGRWSYLSAGSGADSQQNSRTGGGEGGVI